MHENDLLLQAFAAAEQRDEALVLATVVRVEGSAYRRPGARMIIPRYGASTGTISGGCLESEVSKKAWWLTETGPARVRYDTAATDSDDDEAALTFGLGCNGAVSVLFERIHDAAAHPQVQILRRVQTSRQAAAVALITAVEYPALPAAAHTDPQASLHIGQRVFRYADDPALHSAQPINSVAPVHSVPPINSVLTTSGERSISNTLSNGTTAAQPACDHHAALIDAVQTVLDEVLATRRSRQHRCVSTGAELELFVEYLPPAPQLLIFGAGHDALPLCALAKQLGWRVQLIDARAHFARRERFAHADGVHVITLDADLPDTLFDAHSCAVIMSHSLSQDRHWLRNLAKKPLRYLGQLGPRQRTETLIAEISDSGAEGAQLAALLRAQLHYPLGLDLGGSTPDQIALAILAEIIAVLNGRSGGMLRDRAAPIHGVS